MKAVVSLLMLLGACAHGQSLPEADPIAAAAYGYCEHAESLMPREAKPTWRARAKQAVGLPASVMLTAAGYTTDIAMVTVGSVAAAGIICSPFLALEVALQGSGEGTGRCIAEIAVHAADAMPAVVGKTLYEKSRRWRCADMSPASRRHRRLAGCWAKRRDQASLVRAYKHVNRLTQQEIGGCISETERQKVESLVRFLARERQIASRTTR
jgi:hypothetical protein